MTRAITHLRYGPVLACHHVNGVRKRRPAVTAAGWEGTAW
jgi:hypothetical protein